MDAATDAPQSRYYHSQGLRLHFTDWGNPQDPPLLLVHGGLDHSRSWDHLARALRCNFHVVAPDSQNPHHRRPGRCISQL
jgi:pimeloyl-ACP methyl ester carboxylesterase